MRGNDVTTGTGGQGERPAALRRVAGAAEGVILHLAAGDMEAAGKRTKGTGRDGFGGD